MQDGIDWEQFEPLDWVTIGPVSIGRPVTVTWGEIIQRGLTDCRAHARAHADVLRRTGVTFFDGQHDAHSVYYVVGLLCEAMSEDAAASRELRRWVGQQLVKSHAWKNSNGRQRRSVAALLPDVKL